MPINNSIPENGYLRLDQILQVYPVGRTTWWTGVKNGRFPKPVKLSSNITAWRAKDIQKLIKDVESSLEDQQDG